MNLFLTTLKIGYLINIKDFKRFRYKLILNLVLMIQVILVTVILDLDKLKSVTGLDNPILYILTAQIIMLLLAATFHMPRAWAESDISSGRFSYIMTTKAYKRNYFWMYSVILLLIELINMAPAIIGFIYLFTIYALNNNLPIDVLKIILMITLALILTFLVSIINLYAAIVSRKYQLNSSIILIILSVMAGVQYPLQLYPNWVRYLVTFNPIAIAVELWRTTLFPAYTSYLGGNSLLIIAVIQIVLIGLFTKWLNRKMNKTIRINGVGRLLN